METKIGYTNLQALAITFITMAVSFTFGYHMAQILLAYVASSVGLFVLYTLDYENDNHTLWPYNELIRWFGVLVLMVIYTSKGM